MAKVTQRISTCLWFDSQAEDAAKFYTSLFPQSSIHYSTHYGKEGYEIHQQPEGKVMTVSFQLSGLEFVGLNGGPLFKFNPSISFYVTCITKTETDTLWNQLLEGGTVLMPMDTYAWSEQYGWVQDKYGLSWQIALGKISDTEQKIVPMLMFVNKQHGKAEEAIHLYTSIFDHTVIKGLLRHTDNEQEQEGTIKHAQFSLAGQQFMAMDSAFKHAFHFNEAISFVVNCETQQEIDFYWYKLLEGGGKEVACGWLTDRFGVSWQVEPVQLQEMLKSADKEKTERVTKAFMQMKKFDLATLEKAFEGN
jgi:predicted 3-demethylubiquinone-9 3-methyltransferase (glyoxalase superfamily)